MTAGGSWMHQPHTVVRGHRFDLLVIVHDLHLAWPVILPPEINPPVRVDPDAVLPGPIADAQRARRDAVRELAASASARLCLLFIHPGLSPETRYKA